MGRKIWAMIALMTALFATSLAAKERRGDTVRVDLINGAQVQGELLAVGSDSLTVREPSGMETSCGVGEISRVSITRIGKRFPAGFVGFAAGATIGYVLGANPRTWPHDDDTRVWNGVGKGILWGATGALIGALIAKARDPGGQTVVLFEGLNDEQLGAALARLRRSARVRD